MLVGMTLKEGHSYSGKTLRDSGPSSNLGGDKGSPRTRKSPLPQIQAGTPAQISVLLTVLAVLTWLIGFLNNNNKRSLEPPGSSGAKTSHSQCRDLGLIPGQGTRSHILLFKISQAKTRKIPCATTETPEQPNK